MSSSDQPKRLTYIVNYLSADDTQHYVHVPRLLSALEMRGWTIDLLSERGGFGTVEILGRSVTFLSRQSKWKRVANLVAKLLAMRNRGGRLVFVRISSFAALASSLLGRVFGWRTIFWISGTVEDYDLRRGLLGRLAVMRLWILFRLVDRLATGPETMARYYTGRYGLPPSKIVVLYNDVEILAASRRTEATQDQVFRVLMVHRLSPVRETTRYFPNLVDSLSRFAAATGSSVVLDICGDGPERPELERIASQARRPVEIRFHGAIPHRELEHHYRHATIFVMPSYREGFPRVIIEAMAHGLPIVATDAGGLPDLCGPAQQNYVVDRNHAKALGDAVERLLGLPAEREKLAAENLLSVERFSTSAVAQMYDEALSAILGLPSRQ
jgi:glycosyltransferase involved in cell wall biosynthesis